MTLKASMKKNFKDNNKKIFQLRFGKEEENFKNFNKVNIINNDNFRFAYKTKSENKFLVMKFFEISRFCRYSIWLSLSVLCFFK